MRYSKEIVDRIASLVEEDTYTISEICEMLAIGQSTFYKWRAEKEDFAKVLDEAAAKRDLGLVHEARRSLRKKIQGYTAVETKTTYIAAKDVDDEQAPLRVKERVVNEKYHAPDTSAIVFTLSNRDPLNWRAKQATESTDMDREPITIVVASDETKKEIEKLQRGGG